MVVGLIMLQNEKKSKQMLAYVKRGYLCSLGEYQVVLLAICCVYLKKLYDGFKNI